MTGPALVPLSVGNVFVVLDVFARGVKTALVHLAVASQELALQPASRAVIGLVALSAWIIVARSRRRYVANRAVRDALVDANPEVRRAAVLVAAHHGLNRYAGLLSIQVRTEEANSVLLALADRVEAQRWRSGRRRHSELRQWADTFLLSRAGSEQKLLTSGKDWAPWTDTAEEGSGLDALALVEVESDSLDSAEPVVQAKACVGNRQLWRACPNELDALKVLDELVPPGAPRKRTRSAAAANGYNPVTRKTNIDSLLDELAGLEPLIGIRTRRSVVPPFPRSSGEQKELGSASG